jgi:deoxycytidine triphosphate deaminase
VSDTANLRPSFGVSVFRDERHIPENVLADNVPRSPFARERICGARLTKRSISVEA